MKKLFTLLFNIKHYYTNQELEKIILLLQELLDQDSKSV